MDLHLSYIFFIADFSTRTTKIIIKAVIIGAKTESQDKLPKIIFKTPRTRQKKTAIEITMLSKFDFFFFFLAKINTIKYSKVILLKIHFYSPILNPAFFCIVRSNRIINSITNSIYFIG